MLSFACLIWLVHTLFASAIIPEGLLSRNEHEAHLQTRHSLPNLLKIDDASGLPLDWALEGNMELQAGRLTLKDGTGSIWSKNLLLNSKGQWTVEVTFRNSEVTDVEDHLYVDTNGFSFWLLDSKKTRDVLNFGGPVVFDGLQFLINNKGSPGLKIFANDGTSEVINSIDASIGGCSISYLDSMVPTTLRISYSDDGLKVQVDNNLCFSSDQLTLGNIQGDLLYGASASVNAESQEYWELLKLNVYDAVTEDAKDDHGVAPAEQIKVVTQTQKVVEPTLPVRESLMNRAKSALASQSSGKDISELKDTLASLSDRMGGLERTIENFDGSKLIELAQDAKKLYGLADDTKRIHELVDSFESLKQTQASQLDLLQDMKNMYQNFEKLLNSYYKETGDSNRLLTNDVVDQIKQNQNDMLSLNRKLDSIIANHKNLEKSFFDSGSKDLSNFKSIGFLIFLVLCVAAMIACLFVYQIRKEVKHSKLL